MPATRRSLAALACTGPPCPPPAVPQMTMRQSMAQAGRGLLGAVLAFSALVNLLMLTGPFFMLQLYDRVLPARSEATLLALFGLVAFLYAAMVVLDHARALLVARLGARLAIRLERRVFDASLRLQRLSPGDPRGRVALADLDLLQRWLASPVFLSLFDAPWVPAYMALIFILHPLLGWLALGGAVLLLLLAALNQVMVRDQLARAADQALAADRLAEAYRAEAGTLAALGMTGAAFARWSGRRGAGHAAMLAGADRAAFFAAATRGLRLFLQSAMLAAGAWLVLRGLLGPVAMIAASIILGRALAPVEQAVGQWGTIQAARTGWRRLDALLAGDPGPQPATGLSRPEAAGHLSVRGLTVVPPGQRHPSLCDISFDLAPGRVLGVIGPSGAGKSTLAAALAGASPPTAGSVRLDGCEVGAADPPDRGCRLGYLPQRVVLFDGTVAENIARLAPRPAAGAVMAAARAAGAHEAIRALLRGYDTPLADGQIALSGGQTQRIGLARALFGDPALVILDEPDAHLDAEGLAALGGALRGLRARGATVVVIAHRPSVLAACDDLLVLDAGRAVAHGPRPQILADLALHAGRRPGAASDLPKPGSGIRAESGAG